MLITVMSAGGSQTNIDHITTTLPVQLMLAMRGFCDSMCTEMSSTDQMEQKWKHLADFSTLLLCQVQHILQTAQSSSV